MILGGWGPLNQFIPGDPQNHTGALGHSTSCQGHGGGYAKQQPKGAARSAAPLGRRRRRRLLFFAYMLYDFSTIFCCFSMFFNDFCRKDWFPRPLLSRPLLGVTEKCFKHWPVESQSSKNKKRHKTGHRGRFSSSDRSFPTSLTPRNIFQADFFVENGIFDQIFGGNCQS